MSKTEYPPWLRAAADGAELAVHVQPGAGKAEIVGAHGEALKIRLTARPVEGAANTALITFIADTLGLARREVRILRGEKSRQKVVRVSLDAPETARRLLEHASK